MGNTGYAFLLCPDCSAQIRKQPEYKFRLIAGSTNESITDNPQPVSYTHLLFFHLFPFFHNTTFNNKDSYFH